MEKGKSHKETYLLSSYKYSEGPTSIIPIEVEEKFEEWVEMLGEDMFTPSIDEKSIIDKLKSQYYRYNLESIDRLKIIIVFNLLISSIFLLLFFKLYFTIVILLTGSIFLFTTLQTTKTSYEYDNSVVTKSSLESYKFRISNVRAESYAEKGDYTMAIRLYNTLINKYPNSWFLYNNKGFCEIMNHQLDVAQKTYETFKRRVEEYEQNNFTREKYLSIILNQMGNIFEKNSKLQEAYFAYKQSAKINERESVIINLLSICIKLNNLEEAYIWLTKLKGNSNYNETLNLLSDTTILRLKKLSWIS